MYSLMIFDDHKYIIDGIKETIDFEKLNITFIDYAYDGLDGLNKILEKKPDIVITDINMPNMTGLEMIEKTVDANLKTKFILITGYSDFNYAQSAIKYGVSNYIVKPVLPKDITDALNQAVKLCEDENDNLDMKNLISENMPILKENFIYELFSETVMEENEFYDKSRFFNLCYEDKYFRVITVNIDSQSEITEETKQYLHYKIINVLSKKFNSVNSSVTFKNNMAHIIVNFPKNSKDFFEDSFIIDELKEIIAEFKEKHNIIFSVGVGNLAKSYIDIHNSYNQSKEALKHTFCFGEGTVIFYEDILNTQIISPYIELFDRCKLTDSLKMHNINGVRQCINDMLIKLEKVEFINSDYVKIIISEMFYSICATLYNMGETNIYSLIKKQEYIKQINEMQDLTELKTILADLCEKLEHSINIKTNQRTSRIVEQIIDYIANNYAHNVSLEILSKHIYLTPNYLSSIFITHTNMSFKNYLTNYRMEKAKEMLLTNDYKVYEVSELVGYKNPTYFRKLFKEYIGESPTNFINDLKS